MQINTKHYLGMSYSESTLAFLAILLIFMKRNVAAAIVLAVFALVIFFSSSFSNDKFENKSLEELASSLPESSERLVHKFLIIDNRINSKLDNDRNIEAATHGYFIP